MKKPKKNMTQPLSDAERLKLKEEELEKKLKQLEFLQQANDQLLEKNQKLEIENQENNTAKKGLNKLLDNHNRMDILPPTYMEYVEENREKFDESELAEIEDYDDMMDEKKILVFDIDGDETEFDEMPVREMSDTTGELTRPSTFIKFKKNKKGVDFNYINRLLSIGTSRSQLVVACGVSENSLEKKVQKYFKISLAEYCDAGKVMYHLSLRKAINRKAMGLKDANGDWVEMPSERMLIFLAKAELGMSEKIEIKSEVKFGLDDANTQELLEKAAELKKLLGN